MAYSRVLTCALLGLFLSGHALAEVRLFNAGSFSQIEAEHSGQPFIVALWSLDCAPCFKELAVLASWQKVHPSTRLVLISTDDSGEIDEVDKALRGYSLPQASQWIFADDFAQRLRYSIDKNWRGELPRSYFYSKDNSRKAHSGTLTLDHLKQWSQESNKADY